MKDIRILIVEDEFILSEQLTNALNRLGYSVSGIAITGEDAIVMCETQNPDIVIMDIMLSGDLDGIDTALILRKKYQGEIIFLTGLKDNVYFERAKYSKPASYLNKPFNLDELYKAIELAFINTNQKEVLLPKDIHTSGSADDFIFVKDAKNRYTKVFLTEIVYIKAEGAYSKIVTRENIYTASGSLRVVEEKISNSILIRVHRSYLVNITHVKQILGKNEIVLDIVEESEDLEQKLCKIPIGNDYKDNLDNLFRII